MSEEQGHMPESERPGLTIGDLLSQDVSGEPEFLTDFARRKAFRVRGLDFVRGAAGLDIAGYAPLLAQVSGRLASHPALKALPFAWDEVFSIRQMYDAAAKQPLRLDKAILVCMLCEAAFAAPPNGDAPLPVDLLYAVNPGGRDGNLRIEPALFRVQDVSAEFFTRLRKHVHDTKGDDADRLIRSLCRQDDKTPHIEMADGKSVSHRLATRVRAAISQLWPAAPIGEVTLARRANGGPKRKQTPAVCETETVEGFSAVDPDEPFA